jgi:phosphonate transport system substrate-binding protein
MISRWFLLFQVILLLVGCSTPPKPHENLGKMVVGIVAYGEGARSLEQYQPFDQYLETRLKTLVELEPAFNELKAVEQIQRQEWAVVFAPPGLAAIAIAKANYLPLFPLEGVDNQTSVLVVQKQSPIQKLTDVTGKRLALGQPGSATGYYVPLYELYGTSPSEVRISPTPRTVLDWVARGEVEVGALAKDELERYQTEFNPVQFRILHTSRRIPAGGVLIGPQVDRNQQKLLQEAMNQAVPAIAQQAGYIPNAPPPDYKALIAFIEKVKPIEIHLKEKPAPLYQSGVTPP